MRTGPWWRGDDRARRGRRARSHAFAAAAVLVLAGCGDNGQSTLAPAARPAHQIDTLWWVMFIGSVVVFAVVVMLLLIGVARRRGRVGEPPVRTPAGLKLVVAGGVVLPIAAIVVLFFLTVRAMPSTAAEGAGGGRLLVQVVGRQWFWDVRYPQQRFVTANEIHVPVGQPVTLEVTTADVAHSFWVPELNRKIDMIPRIRNRITLRADHAGVYQGQCAEFCGLQHAHMAFSVVADPPDRFARWVAGQQRPAGRPADGGATAGEHVFLTSTCAYCHTVAGTSATGRIGPDLTHLASRMAIAARTLANGRGQLGGWILDPQHVKPGNKMPPTDLSGPQLQALLDYLESLK